MLFTPSCQGGEDPCDTGTQLCAWPVGTRQSRKKTTRPAIVKSELRFFIVVIETLSVRSAGVLVNFEAVELQLPLLSVGILDRRNLQRARGAVLRNLHGHVFLDAEPVVDDQQRRDFLSDLLHLVHLAAR